MNRTFAPFVITAMTASSMSLTGSCRRQVYWSDSAKLLVASDTIAACRDRRQEIRKFLTSLAKILRSSSGYGLNSMSNSKNIEDATPNRVLKNSASRLLKKVQMRGARENRRAEAYLPIRWSEAIERNEADGPFSTSPVICA